MGFTNLNPNKNKYFAVPEELKGYKNWVCWQSYPDPKSHSGISKKPINPRTGGFAMPNNSDTWSDFCQIFGYRLYVLKFTVFRC